MMQIINIMGMNNNMRWWNDDKYETDEHSTTHENDETVEN